MFCRHCGKEINAAGKFCGGCGAAVIGKRHTRARKVVFSVIGIALILVVLFLSYNNTDEDVPESTGLIYELRQDIQPVGIFDEPALYESENISAEEWLTHFKYLPVDDAPARQTQQFGTQFPNQKTVFHAVVKIVCETPYGISQGSGTNMEPAGYVFTNFHVIEDASGAGCVVGFPNPNTGLIEEAYWAVPIVDDDGENHHDLAILSIEEPVVDSEFQVYGYWEKLSGGEFPYFEWLNSCSEKTTNLGDDLFVVGYPYISGGALTVTSGLVSSLYSADNYIVTSAKIGSGNSGGLALDGDGCYIGVPTAVYGADDEEFFGEVIDAQFVAEFYDAVEDELKEYQESLGN